LRQLLASIFGLDHLLPSERVRRDVLPTAAFMNHQSLRHESTRCASELLNGKSTLLAVRSTFTLRAAARSMERLLPVARRAENQCRIGFQPVSCSQRGPSSYLCVRRHELDRALRDSSLGWRFLRHFVPGYDHAVPTGRNTFFPAEALIKLALVGVQPKAELS
jgi:hypothetical protein